MNLVAVPLWAILGLLAAVARLAEQLQVKPEAIRSYGRRAPTRTKPPQVGHPAPRLAPGQPFTPFIETLRGLLTGTPTGDNAILAIGWCAVITIGGYLWARKLYNREPNR